MRVGVPTEIKQDEYRVAITPAGVRELTDAGHEVVVQVGAGEGSATAARRSSIESSFSTWATPIAAARSESR